MFWLSMASLVLLLAVYIGTYKQPVHHPSPTPFSCASLLRSASVLDAGGQIAPVCGATPYPQTIPPNGG